jgi:hypothetical protein
VHLLTRQVPSFGSRHSNFPLNAESVCATLPLESNSPVETSVRCAYLTRKRPAAALNVSISLGDVSALFCLANFFYVPKLHHNAAVSKIASCKRLNWKDLAGAWRFELQTSCAQGKL